MNSSVLEGIRIADFSWVLAGPYATMLLAYLGAEVIKIESRKRLDQTRTGSPTLGQANTVETSTSFNEVNVNKLSVTLDLSSPTGVELAKQIVRISDVVVENMRPGVMDRLGLGYKDMEKIKPDIIMLSCSSYGATGPYREYTGFAPHFAAFGGLAYMTGYPDGEPNPMTNSIDNRVGTTASFAILAALIFRQRTGQGQYIDLSCPEALSVLIGDTIMDYVMNQRLPSRMGNRDSIMAPHNCYRCKGEDKWISIAVSTDEEWKTLCQAMNNPPWTKDKAFSDSYDRYQNQEHLDRLIENWTINYDNYKLMKLLQDLHIAAMPSFNAEEIFSDPHIKTRVNVNEVQHPVMGKKVVLNPPWKFSETPARIEKSAPLLGEHNLYIFNELLGIPREDITKLMEDKIIY